MKSETELKNLPPEERQKIVIELQQVKTGDKAYANAKAIIDLIENSKGYEKPDKLRVKNISGHAVTVDDVVIAPDATGSVYTWQYHALARFLQPEAAYENHLSELSEKQQALDKKTDAANQPQTVDLGKVVPEAIAKGFESLKTKAAALILLAFLLCFATTAKAQNQTTVFGSPAGAWTVGVAGLIPGSTNSWAGTNNSFSATVLTTNFINQPSVTYSNGVAYFTTNSAVGSILTNTPGLVYMGDWDAFGITWSFQTVGGGTQPCTNTWDISDDLATWQTNWMVLYGPGGAIGAPTTGSTNVTGFHHNWIRLGQWYMATNVASAANQFTNTVMEVTRKHFRSGQ